MGKTYVRVDDRLIHGQTIVAWCPLYKIDEIIAVDDESAKNPMLKSILTMSVPSTYKAEIVSAAEASEILSSPSEKNRLVIVKFPAVLQALKSVLSECEEIVLGNLAKKADSMHQLSGATGIFFLSEQDLSEIDNLSKDGFEIKFQQLPSTTSTSWETFKKSL